MEPRRVLVVERERILGLVIGQTLEAHDCEVSLARSGAEALELLEGRSFDAALLDVVLPGASGLHLLRVINERWPSVAVLVMTSPSSLDSAMQALREGAYDCLHKPFQDVEEIWVSVHRALEKAHLTEKSRAILRVLTEQNKELAGSVRRLTSLIEASRAMGELRSLPELLEFFVDLVCRELDVGRVSLMLVDPAGEHLTIATHRGLDGFDASLVKVRLGDGIAGRVACEAQPLHVEDVRSDPRLKGGRSDLASSFISAPLVLSVPAAPRCKVLGVLNVTNRRCAEPLGPDELDYVRGMASQIAVCLESARRFDDLQKAYESLRDAQQQLVASERLKAVGEMAAGVAHDFNNALAVILGRTETCLMRLDTGEELDRARLRKDLEAIVKVSLQGAETIRRVQDFTRIRKDTPRDLVDLDQVIRDAVEMTRPKWKGEAGSRGQEIEVDAQLGGVPPVLGNRHELTQVISNVIFNAVEAMPEGGRLSFRTSSAEGRVLVEAADTGVGMDEEARRRVFEPFFTTKDKGNGLGMSIVYGILTRHDATIDVESAPGQGTRFRLSFRVASEEAAPTPADAAPAAAARPARILFVDDDEIVRQTIQQYLENDGHQVTAVSSGRGALDAFDPALFDVVITDFNMPGMSGVELAGRLREKAGEFPVILLSGWAFQEKEEVVRAGGIDYTLPKPCPAATLRKTIGRALDSRRKAR